MVRQGNLIVAYLWVSFLSFLLLSDSALAIGGRGPRISLIKCKNLMGIRNGQLNGLVGKKTIVYSAGSKNVSILVPSLPLTKLSRIRIKITASDLELLSVQEVLDSLAEVGWFSFGEEGGPSFKLVQKGVVITALANPLGSHFLDHLNRELGLNIPRAKIEKHFPILRSAGPDALAQLKIGDSVMITFKNPEHWSSVLSQSNWIDGTIQQVGAENFIIGDSHQKFIQVPKHEVEADHFAIVSTVPFELDPTGPNSMTSEMRVGDVLLRKSTHGPEKFEFSRVDASGKLVARSRDLRGVREFLLPFSAAELARDGENLTANALKNIGKKMGYRTLIGVWRDQVILRDDEGRVGLLRL